MGQDVLGWGGVGRGGAGWGGVGPDGAEWSEVGRGRAKPGYLEARRAQVMPAAEAAALAVVHASEANRAVILSAQGRWFFECEAVHYGCSSPQVPAYLGTVALVGVGRLALQSAGRGRCLPVREVDREAGAA